MSESMALQQRGVSVDVWLKLLLENMRMFAVRAATRGNVNVHGKCRTDSASHWMQRSGDLVPSLTGGSTQHRDSGPWA